jgi:hypothetical protein
MKGGLIWALATSAEHNGGRLKHASTLEIRQDSAKKPYSSLLFAIKLQSNTYDFCGIMVN